nr:MAG TPA: hypothetical protein [Caudoviricetes sp.]
MRTLQGSSVGKKFERIYANFVSSLNLHEFINFLNLHEFINLY